MWHTTCTTSTGPITSLVRPQIDCFSSKHRDARCQLADPRPWWCGVSGYRHTLLFASGTAGVFELPVNYRRTNPYNNNNNSSKEMWCRQHLESDFYPSEEVIDGSKVITKKNSSKIHFIDYSALGLTSWLQPKIAIGPPYTYISMSVIAYAKLLWFNGPRCSLIVDADGQRERPSIVPFPVDRRGPMKRDIMAAPFVGIPLTPSGAASHRRLSQALPVMRLSLPVSAALYYLSVHPPGIVPLPVSYIMYKYLEDANQARRKNTVPVALIGYDQK